MPQRDSPVHSPPERTPAPERPAWDDACLRLLADSFDQALHSIVITDTEVDLPGPRILYVNQAFTRMTGYTFEEVQGRSPRILQGPATSREQLARLRAALIAAVPFQGRAINYRKDGTPFHLDWSVAPVRAADGTLLCFVAFQQDVTAFENLTRSQEAIQSVLLRAQRISRIGSWDLDVQTNHLTMSEEALRICGLPTTQAAGTAEEFAMLAHPEDRDRLLLGLRQFVERTGNWSAEYRIRRPSGEVRWVQALAELVQGEGGAPVQIVGTLQDITDRRSIQQALVDSEARFRMAARSSSDSIYDWDMASGTFKWFGRAEEQLGYPPGTFSSIPALESVIHPEDRRRVQAAQQQMLAERRSQSIEYRVLCRDGSIRYWLDRATTQWDESGRPVRLVGVISDITGRKRAEEDLRQAKADLEVKVEERTRELHVMLDRQAALVRLDLAVSESLDLRVALQNVAAETAALLGASAGSVLVLFDDTTGEVSVGAAALPGLAETDTLPELLARSELNRHIVRTRNGVTVRDIHDPASHPAAVSLASSPIRAIAGSPLLAQARILGVLYVMDLKPREYAADEAAFLASISRRTAVAVVKLRLLDDLRASNDQLAKEVADRLAAEKELAAARDAAERARQSAEEANKAKSEFLSRMSHELRTPLNAILGFAQLMEMRAEDPKDRVSIGHILHGGKHLLGLINEVLDISRIEAGRLTIVLEPVDAAAIVRQAIELVRPDADTMRLTIDADDSTAESLWTMADPNRLRQVLLNLLSNAIKYNHPDGRIAIRFDSSSPAHAAIAISNTGPGIAPEVMHRLFTPFDRLGAEQTGVEGSGLGLALSRRLTEAMHGELSLASPPGGLTTATLELRTATPSAISLPGTRAAETAGAIPAVPEGRILYIEDNASNRELVGRIFSHQPQVVLESAATGEEGLRTARESSPHLILLDLSLPDIHGTEVLTSLKASEETRNIPVLILTADVTTQEADRLVALGAAAFMTKPFRVTDLLRTVTTLLDQHKASQ